MRCFLWTNFIAVIKLLFRLRRTLVLSVPSAAQCGNIMIIAQLIGQIVYGLHGMDLCNGEDDQNVLNYGS